MRTVEVEDISRKIGKLCPEFVRITEIMTIKITIILSAGLNLKYNDPEN